MAQALVRHLAALRIEMPMAACAVLRGRICHLRSWQCGRPGRGTVGRRGVLPTWRAHNEQAMAPCAIAYAKAGFRQRMMAVTTSIGPGATNLLTAAALAHVNRLPLLMLPGDTFASRAPDPVLQQLEDFGHGDVSGQRRVPPADPVFRPHQPPRADPARIAARDLP
jgi:3D-(3,5/4)-trihydroxycyclohexane-1,2-dione acylhydrolase (decyclizing)